MENNTRKYILVPEYRPLWAMRKCFGPTHGPLTQPCPTSLDIIRDLLLQTGKDAVTIMEVIPEGKGYSEPVQLTLDNYKLPYEEIRGGRSIPAAEVIVVDPEPKVEVEPVIAEAPVPEPEPEPAAPAEPEKEPEVPQEPVVNDTVIVVEDTGDAEAETTADVVETAEDEVIPEGEDAPAEESESKDDDAAVTNPYAGMTKSQRRAARKAAEAEAAKNNQ